jgi:phosphoribosyl-AMP cyclohydrolase / phosphoribosyl-ATP pyrophosphohydrolase
MNESSKTLNTSTLKYDAQGLIIGVIQSISGEVRMVGYFNAEALRRTMESGYVTFWSRSRQAFWTKGETSGNRLKLASMHSDCDSDALLVIAEPEGPTCHRGTESCFDEDQRNEALPSLPWLGRLEALLRSRKMNAHIAGSYTEKLFAQGTDRIAKKVVEEAGEVVLAAKNLQAREDAKLREEFLGEAADLLFHLELLLLDRGASLMDLVSVLRARHGERRAGAK